MSFLIIQTAFIGDVILATGLIEKLRAYYPDATIDFMVRKGNEAVLVGHPHVGTLYVWDKQGGKFRNLLRILRQIRRRRYDCLVNVQRFATTGWLTVFSGARETVGFDVNPLSRFFDRVAKHESEGSHEIVRNHALVRHLTDDTPARPRLYPSSADYQRVALLQAGPYVCIAPTSVWFTKQLPAENWLQLIARLPEGHAVYLLGAPADRDLCEQIAVQSQRKRVRNLAGELPLLASAALMERAAMNYVNDSAPMHLASAMNAPVCAVFCSTAPMFGYGPLSDRSFVVEKEGPLACRPCGVHGYATCPEGHFRCAKDIRVDQFPVPGV